MTQQTIPVAPVAGWPAPGDPARRPRILAADLSLRSTGLAWTDRAGQIGVATIRPATTGHERLNQLLWEITRQATREEAQLAVIEEPIIGNGSALGLAGLYALVTHALWLRQIPYVTVHLKRVKMYATGKGGGPDASKQAVLVAMQRLFYGHGPLIRGDDEADAAALLALALDALGTPLADVPAANRRAVAAVKWPEVRRG